MFRAGAREDVHTPCGMIQGGVIEGLEFIASQDAFEMVQLDLSGNG